MNEVKFPHSIIDLIIKNKVKVESTRITIGKKIYDTDSSKTLKFPSIRRRAKQDWRYQTLSWCWQHRALVKNFYFDSEKIVMDNFYCRYDTPKTIIKIGNFPTLELDKFVINDLAELCLLDLFDSGVDDDALYYYLMGSMSGTTEQFAYPEQRLAARTRKFISAEDDSLADIVLAIVQQSSPWQI